MTRPADAPLPACADCSCPEFTHVIDSRLGVELCVGCRACAGYVAEPLHAPLPPLTRDGVLSARRRLGQ